jgi:hypothetical protein
MSYRNKTIARALAVAISVGALAPAAASAHFDNLPNKIPPVPVLHPNTSVQVVRDGGGFDWGDAGIGAAAGIGLSILGATGLSTARRRDRQSPSPAIR